MTEPVKIGEALRLVNQIPNEQLSLVVLRRVMNIMQCLFDMAPPAHRRHPEQGFLKSLETIACVNEATALLSRVVQAIFANGMADRHIRRLLVRLF